MSALTGWIATAGHIVGNLETWATEYAWDGTVHQSRRAAIRHGWNHFGHDDFNVGHIEKGVLVWWGWMDEKHPDEDRPLVADELNRSLGLSIAVPTWIAVVTGYRAIERGTK